MGAADAEENVLGNQGGLEKILVSVRLRPLNEREITRNDVSDWECINDTTIVYRNNLSVSERSMYPSAYAFDRVFNPDCSTRQVYDEGAKGVALSVVGGINSSVFAYGQTSSGKTYTMSGITLYTVADIYDYIEKHTEREYILKFSAMEIYNESVRDLLSTDPTPLRLLDDPERGTVVERLTEESLRDWNHFRELLAICEAQRQIGETSLNETSSRSHQILRLVIESSVREFLGNQSSTLMAAVNFVDLAGSERASQSLAAGARLKEGCHINRSLLTLGTVIRKLSKGRTGHIPYRDSKLTRILQSSLGGNARTAIICTLSPARCHVEQSRNTLLFASCAKEVSTNAQVNVVMSDKALVKQLQRELARLENELKSTGRSSSGSDSTPLLIEKDRQIERLMTEVCHLTQQLELAQSKVSDLLQAADDERSTTIWINPQHQYPKLRVRNSFRSENSVSGSLHSEDPPSIDGNIRSFAASRCSTHSRSSSEENFIRLEDLQENFLSVISSPELSIRHVKSVGYDRNEKDTKQPGNEQYDDMCKELQCISVEELSIKSHTNLNLSEYSPNRQLNSKKVGCIKMETSSPERFINSNISESGLDMNVGSGVSLPQKNASCSVSSPKINSSSGSSSPRINTGSCVSSPKIHSSSGFSSPKINAGSGMSSVSDRNTESGASSPKINAQSGVSSSPDMNAGSDMSSLETNTGFNLLFSLKREAGSVMSSPKLNTGSSISSTPDRNVGSCMSSPKINTGSSGVTEVENEDTVHQDIGPSPLKEPGNVNGLNSGFIIPSPERPSPWHMEEGMSSSRSLKLIRSRSCRARLLSLPVIWYDKEETNESTPLIGFDKEITGKPAVAQREVPELKSLFHIENLSETSRSSVAVDDLTAQPIETVTDCKVSGVSSSEAGEYAHDLVEDTKEKLSVSSKSIRDVGLDPILDDVEPQKWPSEFKRLQKEIVELWQACNVSLVHRSYFFLLFKGDPADAFYMEVERRRMSFLKETLFSGNKAKFDGRTQSLSSSKRTLSEERQMLCKQMQRVLSRDERENIFLKWDIPLNSNQRKLQLAYYLWSKTTDMDHIIESATLVAKLVGFEEQDHSYKEMFGLLSFQPRRLNKRRSSIWKRSMLSIL